MTNINDNLSSQIHQMCQEHGYLYESGWIKSIELQKPVDKYGNLIPWYTYPAIKFITERISSNLNIFEYGCGYSTIWYSQRVKKISTLEDNIEWYNKISAEANSSISSIILCQDLNEYVKKIHDIGGKYDIIINDGQKRRLATYEFINYLKDDGVVIFDNSERLHYQPAYDFLEDRGFKRLDFFGHAPMITKLTQTTIFYRKTNIFKL